MGVWLTKSSRVGMLIVMEWICIAAISRSSAVVTRAPLSRPSTHSSTIIPPSSVGSGTKLPDVWPAGNASLWRVASMVTWILPPLAPSSEGAFVTKLATRKWSSLTPIHVAMSSRTFAHTGSSIRHDDGSTSTSSRRARGCVACWCLSSLRSSRAPISSAIDCLHTR